MLSGRLPLTLDTTGAVFIDRDGEYFGYILTWLRTRELSTSVHISKLDVLREAKFYLLDKMIEQMERSIVYRKRTERYLYF